MGYLHSFNAHHIKIWVNHKGLSIVAETGRKASSGEFRSVTGHTKIMPPERPQSKHNINSGTALGFISITWIESRENIRNNERYSAKWRAYNLQKFQDHKSQETVRNYFRLQKPKAMWPVNATHYSEQEPFTLKDDWWLNGAWGLDGSKLSMLIYWF